MLDILRQLRKDSRGDLLLFVMVFGSIAFAVIIVGLAGYAILENRASVSKHNSEMAFQIADAGINYYRWHLAHNKTDFYDGNSSSTPGPYVHDYKDKNGNVIGHFSLEVGAPPAGSTIVIITSTGWLDIQPNSKRKILVKLGFPALTDYAFLTGSNVWIGNNEETHGKFHANGGIRFDGIGDAPITSAMATYTCTAVHGCQNLVKPGVWGQGGPTQYWQFPVPSTDFTAVTADLAQIQDLSDPDKGGLNLTSSGQQGWHLQFNSNGTITAKKVLTTSCYKAKDINMSNYFWPCIDISTEGTGTNYSMPSDGFIFIDDNVWVDGTVKGRAVIGTSAGKNILINGSILYLAKDGSCVLGLIADQNVLIPHNSPDSLEIDAAVLAQNGAAKRYYYPGDMKSNLLIFGSVISNQIWTWSWVSQGGAIVSGYRNTNSTYDSNLTYGPPPGFPVGSQYNLISWAEVK